MRGWCAFVTMMAIVQVSRTGGTLAQDGRPAEKQADVVLTRGEAKAVLTAEGGGRPLEFSLAGKQALWRDEQDTPEKGKQRSISAGRFDIGPELTIPAHPKLWSGAYTAKNVTASAAQLVSQPDDETGVQLTRDFELRDGGSLLCKQTITNISKETKEYCHWGRSFSPGKGICLIPLAGQSRFPSKYAMYEDSAIINVKSKDEQIRERDGFLEILAPPRKPKLGFDSQAGWLAYVMPGDVLFVKRFPVHPDRVYSEAAGLTLSVWYPQGTRIELEPIGPRERLKSGESASFTEEWFLFDFPFPKSDEQVDLKQLRTRVMEAFEKQAKP